MDASFESPKAGFPMFLYVTCLATCYTYKSVIRRHVLFELCACGLKVVVGRCGDAVASELCMSA